MRFRTIYVLFGILISLIIESPTLQAKANWTLEDAYQQALTQDESIQISQEKLNELKGQFLQILGGSLPQIKHTDSFLFQDNSPNSNSSTFTKTVRPQSGFNLEVPLFKGFQEYHVAKLKRAALAKTKYDIKQEELNLYADIARVYIAWTKLHYDLTTTNELINASNKRVNDTKKDIDLGKKLTSHLYAEQAELKRLLANKEKINGDLSVTEDTLRWMLGMPACPKLSPVSFNYSRLPNPESTPQNRPDVKAQIENTQITNRELKVSQAKLLPHIDADANYYHYRTGFQNDIVWDSTIEMNLPLVNAEYWGEIKMNKSKHLQAILQERQKIKQASLEFNEAKDNFTSLKNQVGHLRQAVELAKKRFESSKNDYQLGLIDNLDLLQAQKDYLDVVLESHNVNSEIQQAYVNYWLLSGQKP